MGTRDLRSVVIERLNKQSKGKRCAGSPNVEMSQQFFATVQNKMHWAAHGHTAAEIVAERADASKPNIGLTSWSGSKPRKSDVSIAKNYLNQDELDALNRIVTAYLEFAELPRFSFVILFKESRGAAASRCTWLIGSQSWMISSN